MNQERENNNGWLIAVVIAIVVLLIGVVVASGVIGYKLFQKASAEGKSVTSMKEDDSTDENEEDKFDFGFERDYEYKGDKGTEPEEEEKTEQDEKKHSTPEIDGSVINGISGAYNIEDYSYTDEKNGEVYYKELKDATRTDLDYSVSWQDYSYESDYENVYIIASYPKLTGENIPNLDYINEYIFEEVEYWVESFEDYVDEGYFGEDDDFSFMANAYVTYMDEEKISIVYYEYGEADGSIMYYLYSINVDVQNGVILDNASIIDMDEEFAVEFRERNREQNSADGYIDEMSDQEIKEYLNSPTMGVVFYTPLGLEVGVNLDYGWYTVTFRDYEKYLKKL